MSDSKQMEDLQRELDTLKEREKSCATMGEAQKVALVKAFQECCDALGIDSMRTSPADLVREVTRRCSVRPTTGSRSEPPIPDRRTGPPDRRLNGHGLLWFGFEAERSSAPGRRSMDKYYRQEPRPPEDHCT